MTDNKLTESDGFSQAKNAFCARVDIAAAFAVKPPPISFIIPSFAEGTVGILSSPGSAGKSMLAMQLAAGVAGGPVIAKTLGIPTSLQEPSPVFFVAGEDPDVVLRHRLNALGELMTDEGRAEVAKNLHMASTVGSGINICDAAHQAAFLHVLKEIGPKLVIVDTLSRVHGADENSNGEMSQVLARFEHVAKATGAGVLILHHVSKGAALNGLGDQQQASRGASAIVDNARFGASLTTMTEKEAPKLEDVTNPSAGPSGRSIESRDERRLYVRFSIPKSNYGPPIPDQWFRRGKHGVLQPATLRALGNKEAKTTKRKRARDVEDA